MVRLGNSHLSRFSVIIAGIHCGVVCGVCVWCVWCVVYVVWCIFNQIQLLLNLSIIHHAKKALGHLVAQCSTEHVYPMQH